MFYRVQNTAAQQGQAIVVSPKKSVAAIFFKNSVFTLAAVSNLAKLCCFNRQPNLIHYFVFFIIF